MGRISVSSNHYMRGLVCAIHVKSDILASCSRLNSSGMEYNLNNQERNTATASLPPSIPSQSWTTQMTCPPTVVRERIKEHERSRRLQHICILSVGCHEIVPTSRSIASITESVSTSNVDPSMCSMATGAINVDHADLTLPK